jgi:outer membrane protein TolC
MLRRSLLSLVLAVLPTLALAQALPDPLDLSAAADLAVEASVDVRTARLDLDAAERELARVEADPTSLRVPTLEARHAAQAARDALRDAEAQARDAAADGFETALEARDRVAIAEAALAIARTEAEATRIRLDAGAATRSDLDRAEDAVRSAERDLRDARQAHDLARDRLAVTLGVTDELPVLDDAPVATEVPSVDDALARLSENSALRAAGRGVDLAQAAYDAVNVAFTVPRSEIEAARDRLDTARLRETDLESSLRLAVRQAHNAVSAAEGRLASARERVATAEEDLRVQRVRFETGSVAEISLERARLDLQRSRADERAALHALADALRGLETTILGAGS